MWYIDYEFLECSGELCLFDRNDTLVCYGPAFQIIALYAMLKGLKV